jgi:dTDP-4-dehydrorhamnose 3,5-epimerase
MKITEVKSLPIGAVKVIQFARFKDERGYFTEHYRRGDFEGHAELGFMRDIRFLQCNESFSRQGTLRGLHFQWNPLMGKLVRTTRGRMLDIVLDIRKGSPTLGKALLYDMPHDPEADDQEWIWVPPGFAHGNVYPEESTIEYFCSGEYSPGCEAGISPLAADIDWSMCDAHLKATFDGLASTTALVTDKDRNGFTVGAWLRDERSDNFTLEKLGIDAGGD